MSLCERVATFEDFLPNNTESGNVKVFGELGNFRGILQVTVVFGLLVIPLVNVGTFTFSGIAALCRMVRVFVIGL